MEDAVVIAEFLKRERSWVQTLQALRSFHATQMGKVTTNVQWLQGRELGRLSWLGYYWQEEVIWFGYGMHQGVWRPLIEADNRCRTGEVLESLRTEMAGTWEVISAERNRYRRLWSAMGVAGRAESEFEWFKARSRELHEFVVQPAT